jgi:hypothetical protein
MTRTEVGFKCPACIVRHGQASRRRRPPVLVLVAAVVALVGAVVVLRPDGGETGDPVGTPTRAEAAPAAQVMLGEEADDGQLGFVVTDFGCGEEQIGGRVAEGKFCRMAVRAHNRSGGPAVLLGRFQYLVDGQKTFGPDIALSQTLAGNAGVAELTINPEIAVDLVLIYDVPENLDPVEAQLRGTGRSRLGVRVRLEVRS